MRQRKMQRYSFHSDGVRAGCGRFEAAHMSDALAEVERRLGFTNALDWWPDGTRMVANDGATRVVVTPRWPDGDYTRA